jgi:lipopolysaccharide/colanic/teichoic acid biosynthesis glycosyltransferase
MYKFFFKSFIERFVSGLIISLLSPLFLLLVLILYYSNDGKVFFIQNRPGLDGRIFSIIKFKTMKDSRDHKGELLPDSDRLTVVGRVVRKLSLDELPQLLNVFLGQMSLIGPRPLLVEYLPLYNENQKRRHEVKPGITGWAQVNGRNAISWKEKFELDVWYVDHCSFSLDMKILWLTILKVFKREGINQAGQATVEKFNGYN